MLHLNTEGEKILWRSIEQEVEHISRSNAAASALFDHIQAAYVENYAGKAATPDGEIIQFLAACSWVALEYDQNQEIPWDESTHDYILTVLLREFARVLEQDIRSGNWAKGYGGGTIVGCYSVPKEFAGWAQQQPGGWV